MAKTLSFQKTAAILHIVQPAVSKRIKLLEEMLGTELILRHHRRIQLSPEGHELLEQLGPLLGQVENILEGHKERANKPGGKIRFGIINEIPDKIFLPLIGKFLAEHPDIQVFTQYLKAAEINRMIKDGELDFGITAFPTIQENLRHYKVIQDHAHLVCGRSTPFSGQIKNHRFVGYRQSDPLIMSYMQKFHSYLPLAKIHLALTVNSHRMMIELLKQHPLMAVLPFMSFEEEWKRGELVMPTKEKLESNLYFVHREVDFMDKRKRIFKDFLLQAMPPL